MPRALVTPRTQSESTSPDAGLVAGIRAGAPGATRAFYERHAEGVYRTAYRVLGERAQAEEVVQDTFVRAFRALDQLRDPHAAAPWLTSIAVRLAYDALRAQRRRETMVIGIDQVAEPGMDPRFDPLLREQLRRAIGALSPKLRAVLVMYEIEGYAHGEIAVALGIPEATSKTRLFQARGALREALAAYRAPEDRT